MAREERGGGGGVIRRALIVDTETTGLDPKDGAQMIELGAVLYSVENRGILSSCSTLFHVDQNPADNINGISLALSQEGSDLRGCRAAHSATLGFLDHADVIVSHNAEFDRKFVQFGRLPWLCTQRDFVWPRQSKHGQSLVALALAHGIGVGFAHRALVDCLVIAQLFDRVHLYGGDLQAMFAHAMRPKGTFQALVSYDDREKAKAEGFQWEPATKRWIRRMAIADVATLPFRCKRIDQEAAA